MRRAAAQILRLALERPEFARRFVAELTTRPEFQKHVEGKRYRNPETDNKVLYKSLPQKEQRRVYLEWWRAQRREDEGKARDPKKLEEKRQKIERENPWALPLWEYYGRVQEGSGKRHHDPDAIKTHTVEELSWMGPPDGDKLKIGERKFGDDTISFYQSTERQKFVKTDAEGQIVRDPETGNALYMSDEEVLERDLPLFKPGVEAYDGDTPIGFVADEWGATMVTVAEEHQKKGIGTFLSKLWRKARPFKTSGGFSEQGLKTFKRVHQDFVREALKSGEYERGMKEGWLTPARFKEILDSAGLDPEGKRVGEPSVEKPGPSASPEQKKEHTRKMEEFANEYWKAKQRGDKDEAKRVWDEMGDVGA